ncbi:type IV secretory system conjugative DNA transfer family protein [Sphingobium yanoikuyae]|uniref:type IV secretory system conjugative DNA transfer family protein n=2 Tax=Sphingobium yanoikuyae TaxID=13690 RepID=UPI00068BF7F5|nr:type IV secretory system conjugative DNA transfer family protein [Sphingobium yanoikuyae]
MSDWSDWPPAAKMFATLALLVLGAALWSALASLVFLAGTRLLTAHTVPAFQFWTYLRYYGLHQPIVGPWLKIAAVVATAVPLILFAIRVARVGWPGSDRRELHGETRWARRRELVRAGFYEKFGGLYVGKDMAGRHLRFGGPEHVACYAPTRSGKGIGLVIPNCLLYEASLVCLDVKKENWAATAGIRDAAGQKVFLFDPLAPDGRTARYNPFSYVRRGTIDAFDDVQRIAQMIFPEAHGQEKFWVDAGRSAFIGAACFLAETPELPLTIGETLRLLSSVDGAAAMIERIEARRQAGKPYTEATVKALEDYLKGSDDLVNSIRKTVTARLSLWFNPRIDAATADSDFDLRQLRQSLHAIYIGVTPDNIERLRPLLALFFQQLVDLTVRTIPQHDSTAKHQVLLLLDEFPLLGPMPVLANAFAYVAGYNMRIMLIMQSKAQLRDRDLYGPDKADAILENCGLEVVFGTKDLKLTEELSARLGYDTVEGTSRSGPRFWQALRRDKLSMTNSDQRRALLLPQEIARLKPSQAILIRPGMFPIRCRRIRYFRDRLFTRLVRRPPDVEPIEINVRLDQGKGFAPISAIRPQPSLPPESDGSRSGGSPSSLHRASPKPKAGKRRAPAGRRTPDLVDAAESEGEGDGRNAPAISEDPLPPAGETGELPFPPVKPHQSDGLIAEIMGTDVDLSGLGLADGKAAVAAIVDATPTVESLSRGRRRAV